MSFHLPILFLKATTKKQVWIAGYTKADGTVVPPHQSTVHVSDDHSDEKVAAGQGTYSQKQAHAALSKTPGWHAMSTADKAGAVLHHATELQDKASAAAAVSGWKKAAMAGKNPSAAQWAAFTNTLSPEKQAEIKKHVLIEHGTISFLQPPSAADSKSAKPAPKVAAAADKPAGPTIENGTIFNFDSAYQKMNAGQWKVYNQDADYYWLHKYGAKVPNSSNGVMIPKATLHDAIAAGTAWEYGKEKPANPVEQAAAKLVDAPVPAAKPDLSFLDSLILPATNTNAGPVNKKVAAIKQAAEAGDKAALSAMTFGSNTYGKKLAAAKDKVLELLGEKLSAAEQKLIDDAVSSGSTWLLEKLSKVGANPALKQAAADALSGAEKPAAPKVVSATETKIPAAAVKLQKLDPHAVEAWFLAPAGKADPSVFDHSTKVSKTKFFKWNEAAKKNAASIHKDIYRSAAICSLYGQHDMVLLGSGEFVPLSGNFGAALSAGVVTDPVKVHEAVMAKLLGKPSPVASTAVVDGCKFTASDPEYSGFPSVSKQIKEGTSVVVAMALNGPTAFLQKNGSKFVLPLPASIKTASQLSEHMAEYYNAELSPKALSLLGLKEGKGSASVSEDMGGWHYTENNPGMSGTSTLELETRDGGSVFVADGGPDGITIEKMDANGEPDGFPEAINNVEDVSPLLYELHGVQIPAAALAKLGLPAPKDGDTKQGANGVLVFHDGRWHKQGANESSSGGSLIDQWKQAIGKGVVPSKSMSDAYEELDPDAQMAAFHEATNTLISSKYNSDKDDYDEVFAWAHDKANELHDNGLAGKSSLADAPASEPVIGLPASLSFSGYTNTQDGHSKFWRVAVHGNKMIVQYGKIGSTGQQSVKEFPSEAQAVNAAAALATTKNKAGYDYSEDHSGAFAVKGGKSPAPKVVSATEKKPAPASVDGIASADGWKQVGEQEGYNPGGTFEAPDGSRYYVKFPAGGEHVIKNELLATKLYAAAGVAVPEVMLVKKGGKLGIASKIIDAKKDKAALLAGKADGLLSGFAVDAWLANWDTVGNNPAKGFDNILFTPDGKAVRIDAGGSMLYGGAGGKKSDWGPKVIELETMLNPKKNKHTAQVFGSMSAADITASVAKVAKLTNAQILSLVQQFGPGSDAERAELAATLIARRDHMVSQFPQAKKAKATLQPKSASTDTSWVKLKPGEKIVESGDKFGVQFAKVEVPAKGFDAAGLPKPFAYDKSSSQFVNDANTADIQKIYQLALSGAGADAVQNIKFDQIVKATGEKTGKQIGIEEHPSKAWLVEYHNQIVAELKAQLEPTYRMEHNGSLATSYSDAASELAASAGRLQYEQFAGWKKKAADYLVLDEHAGSGIPTPPAGAFQDVQMSDERMIDFKKRSDAAFSKLTDAQKSACKSYTGSSYDNWNTAMRLGNTESSHFKSSKNMRDAFDKAAVELPEGIILHRGLNVGAETYKSVVGAVIQDGSFQSSSYGGKAAFSGKTAQLRMHIGKGVKAVHATTFSHFGTGEREVILDRHTRYLVMKVSTEGGKAVVDVLVLPHEG